MRHPTAFILATLAVLLLSAGCQTVPRDGQGTQTYTNGEVYVGEFKDGKKHGHGTYTFADGGVYVGEFREDRKNGRGTFYLADGTKYVGEYRDAVMHGQGTLTFADGSKYVGEFRDGKANGQGTYTEANGDMYVGEIRNFKRHGQGTLNTAKGDVYVGEFKDGRVSGDGTWTLPNGNVYVGEFKDGKVDGQGTYTHADGRVREGVWDNGKFKYAQKIPPKVYAKKTPTPRVKKKPVTKPSPEFKSGTSGSGFFVSRLGHVVTNEHVVKGCKTLTVGDNANQQVPVEVIETDRRNDLALLKLSSTSMASAETVSHPVPWTQVCLMRRA